MESPKFDTGRHACANRSSGLQSSHPSEDVASLAGPHGLSEPLWTQKLSKQNTGQRRLAVEFDPPASPEVHALGEQMYRGVKPRRSDTSAQRGYSFAAVSAGSRAVPLGAISATISLRGPTARSAMPASPASLRAVS